MDLSRELRLHTVASLLAKNPTSITSRHWLYTYSLQTPSKFLSSKPVPVQWWIARIIRVAQHTLPDLDWDIVNAHVCGQVARVLLDALAIAKDERAHLLFPLSDCLHFPELLHFMCLVARYLNLPPFQQFPDGFYDVHCVRFNPDLLFYQLTSQSPVY